MLIKRAEKDPHGKPNTEGGKWALPGGFIEPNETAYEAAVRELEEETGVTGLKIKHFGVYDKEGRDERGWIISNAHYAIVPETLLEQRKAADDAIEVELFNVNSLSEIQLAFDHKKIIDDALWFIKKDMALTTLAKNFLPKEFVLSELEKHILNDNAIPILIEKINLHINKQAIKEKISTDVMTKELVDIENQINNMISAIMKGFAHEEFKTKMDELKNKKTKIEISIKQQESKSQAPKITEEQVNMKTG